MQITINPGEESPRILLALAAMLTALAGRIPAEDRPDTGTELKTSGTTLLRDLNAENMARMVLPGGGLVGATVTDLAVAFGGAGNVAGSSGTAPSPPPALIGAGSPTTPIPFSAPDAASPAPDLAAAFGGSNSAPLAPTPGTPPAPPSGAPTVGASTLDLDSDGLPWNDKIHSSNKKKTADTGRWMRRRNVPDNVFDAQVAMLRAAVSVPGNVQAAPPPPPPGLTPTAVPLPAITPGAAVSDAVTLPMLLPRITSAMAAGQLTADTAGAIAMELSGGKINNVAMLAIAPQLIPAFWARLDQLGVAR